MRHNSEQLIDLAHYLMNGAGSYLHLPSQRRLEFQYLQENRHGLLPQSLLLNALHHPQPSNHNGARTSNFPIIGTMPVVSSKVWRRIGGSHESVGYPQDSSETPLILYDMSPLSVADQTWENSNS